MVDIDLKKIVMVDNSTISFKLNKDNGLEIKSWYGYEEEDMELLRIMQTLTFMYYDDEEDLRVWIRKLNRERTYTD